MKSPVRTKNRVVLPGVSGTARVDRRTRVLLPRLRPGDIAVLDHLDLDRATAQAPRRRRRRGGRERRPDDLRPLPEPRPEVLADAGVAGPRPGRGHSTRSRTAPRSGSTTSVVYVGEAAGRHGPRGRRADHRSTRWPTPAAAWPPSSRRSPTTAPSSSAASRTCCCTAAGCRALATRIAGPAGRRRGPAATTTRPSWPRSGRSSASSSPVLIGVDRGADALLEAGLHARHRRARRRADDSDRPSAKALRAARDVVVRVDRGGRAAHRPASSGSASARCTSSPPPPPRTPRCCSPTPATPRSSSASGCTPRSTSSSTGSAPGWPAPT